MEATTFIFMGRPGAGKGMQAGLLSEELKKLDHEVVYIGTGEEMRKIRDPGSFAGEIIGRKIMQEGILAPSFLQIANVGHIFINKRESRTFFVLAGHPILTRTAASRFWPESSG